MIATWAMLASFVLLKAGGPKRVTLRDVLCAGCVANVSTASEDTALMVLLHGDGQAPREMLRAWEPWAAPYNIALLALECPPSGGSVRSWWQSDPDPTWLEREVEAFRRIHRIDGRRLWIAGWSGGASYIGWHTQRLEQTFSGLVLHGGGLPPESDGCSDRPSHVYFLTGDSNPLHPLAVKLRAHYDRCRQDVIWTALRGANHEAEWNALPRTGGAIVQWLERITPVRPQMSSDRRRSTRSPCLAARRPIWGAWPSSQSPG